MGNSASNASGPDSPTKMETSDASSTSPRPKRFGAGGHPRSLTIRALDKQQLCSALRAKGLCIRESDLNDVLSKYDNLLEALTFVYEQGLSRKGAKGHPPDPLHRRWSNSSSSSSNNYKSKPQENVRPSPPGPPPSPTTPSCNAGVKRSREGGSEWSSVVAARGERPSKRPVLLPGFSSMGFSSAGGPRPLGNLFAEALRRRPVGEGFSRRGDAESIKSEEWSGTAVTPAADAPRVLAPMQQGSPPTDRLGHPLGVVTLKQHLERSPSPPSTSLRETPARVGLAEMPLQKLFLGEMDATMVEGADQWEAKSREQQKYAVRLVMDHLRLLNLRPRRLERIEKDLCRCLHAAMEDLAQMHNVKDGAATISRKVQETRMMIHDTTSFLAGKYNELYGKRAQSRDGSGNLGHNNNDDDATTDFNNSNNNRSRSRSPKIGGSGRGGYRERPEMDMSPERIRILEEGEEAPSARELFTSVSPTGSGRSKPFAPRSSPNDSGRAQRQQQVLPHPAGSGSGTTASVFGTPFHLLPIGAPMGLGGGGGTSFLPDFHGPARKQSPTPPRRRQQLKVSAAAGGGGSSNTIGARSAQQPTSDEERRFWSALGVCKVALKEASFCRKEEEWLDNQHDIVKCTANQAREKDQAALSLHRSLVESTGIEVKEAADAIESLTKDVIGEHMQAASKEEALRSLISSLQESQGQLVGFVPLEKRKKAIQIKDAAEAKLSNHKTRLILVEHATNVSAVLLDEMFGNLVDVLSGEREQALERKRSSQQHLKSNAKEMLGKMGDAIKFHVTRKAWAEDMVQSEAVKMENKIKYFGANCSASKQSEERFHEMQTFAIDSSNKIGSIVGSVRNLQGKLELELPEEDLDDLTHYLKDILKDKEDLASVKAGGSNPDGMRMPLERDSLGLSDENECNLM